MVAVFNALGEVFNGLGEDFTGDFVADFVYRGELFNRGDFLPGDFTFAGESNLSFWGEIIFSDFSRGEDFFPLAFEGNTSNTEDFFSIPSIIIQIQHTLLQIDS